MSARLAAIALTVLVGCYDVPKPDCGFVCGPADGANPPCPDEYTCADDHRCHRIGTPSSLVCAPPDASVDGPTDATLLDAQLDAAPDAPAVR